MSESAPKQEAPKKESWWHRIQRGQALVEYWPTLPAGVMVMIAAAAIVGPLQTIYKTTTDGLSGITCETPQLGPTYTDLDGGHRIEVVSSNYNGSETTVVFKVSSGDKPSISHWVLGIDKATADKIVYSSEAYESWGLDPTTGKYGIKFDKGYEGKGGGGDDDKGGPPAGKGPKKARIVNPYRPRMVNYVEEREIVLTLTGRVDFVEYVEVTTKAGKEVSTGTITVPQPGVSNDQTC
ncbi:MAG TPA: hypothetical protein VKY59_08585 [Spirillospora sp.]|nr:hypothetical protein [Spirillospora sp.]